MTETTAHLDALAKRYGAQEAVSDVSFRLRAGETVALVGHNGAGKTTLMKLMLGLIRPSAGRLSVLGGDPAARAMRSRTAMGYLPENVAFNPSLTARELLGFYARLKRAPASDRDRLLAQVGLEDAADRRVGTYSKGMRQRLGLAQALIGTPRLLLLDEPTTGLDPELRLGFYEMIDRLKVEGATVLLSSHALTELEERADRVIIMHRGRLVADGTVRELRRLADLPVRMRLAVNGSWSDGHLRRLAGHAQVTQNGAGVTLTCPARDKMIVVREVAQMGPAVTDLQIQPPSLDELYAHFLRERPGP